jgi:anti-sigma-K factor RskA
MNPEDDARAAEFVLGTMSGSERSDFQRELARNRALRDLVGDWEKRLAPLAAGAGEADPPPDMIERIERAIDAADRQVFARVRQLERSRRVWRSLAVAATALAAALALFIVVPRIGGSGGREYIAVVNRGGELPALIVKVDLDRRVLSVQPVSAEAPSDRSLELWFIAAGRSPASLGVMGEGTKTEVLPASLSQSDLKGSAFAVSVEPRGGSPTGSPTGPVVYSGTLIPEPDR